MSSFGQKLKGKCHTSSTHEVGRLWGANACSLPAQYFMSKATLSDLISIPEMHRYYARQVVADLVKAAAYAAVCCMLSLVLFVATAGLHHHFWRCSKDSGACRSHHHTNWCAFFLSGKLWKRFQVSIKSMLRHAVCHPSMSACTCSSKTLWHTQLEAWCSQVLITSYLKIGAPRIHDDMLTIDHVYLPSSISCITKMLMLLSWSMHGASAPVLAAVSLQDRQKCHYSLWPDIVHIYQT